MTGCSVKTLNSDEFASSVPSASRANSMTAHWRPRHSPRNGTRCSSRPADGADLSLHAAVAEAARHEDARHAVELGVDLLRLDALQELRADPAHLHLDVVVKPGMLERLVDADVRVGQLGVLADDGDLDLGPRCADAADQLLPVGQVGLAGRKLQLARDQLAEAGALELHRHLVDALGGLERDDGVDVDIGEQADLVQDLVVDGLVAAQDDDVGLDADAAERADRVLGRLRLQLPGGADAGQPRNVDVQDVPASHVLAHLADRLEERERLDVADRAADLHDHHAVRGQPAGRDRAGPLAGDARDALLDLVRDVRDDLHGAAEVVAAALLGDHALVDPARRDVARLGQVLVDEALVVTEVEIGLGAVVGDEDLAVLVWRHRPRVDVDVRVELQDADRDAAGLQDATDAGGRDALPQ